MSTEHARQSTGAVENFNGTRSVPLLSVPLGRFVELERIELPDWEAEPLLERGVLPGCRVARVRVSPGGDPVISVDGTLLALRRETAARLFVKWVARPARP